MDVPQLSTSTSGVVLNKEVAKTLHGAQLMIQVGCCPFDIGEKQEMFGFEINRTSFVSTFVP